MILTQNPLRASTLRRASTIALQWRLLLLWIVALLIPAALVAAPFWQVLSAQLDHNLHAAELAQQLDAIAIADLMTKLGENSVALNTAGLLALAVTLLLSPLLNGAVVATARADQPLGFSKLLQGGVQEYGRMFRMLLWAGVVLGAAASAGGAAVKAAKNYGERAILEADADMALLAARIVMFTLLVLALVTLDAGRAELAVYSKRPSAIKAWWRGCKLLKARVLAVLGHYLSLSIVGLVLALGITALRIALPQLGAFWFILGMVLAQLAVAAVAWMRMARLLALIDLARP
jgi:hypothetical protein